MHYSLVTGLDILGNKVTIANPYGYVEEISLDEFLDRTRFDAYEDMPLFLKLGFAFGIFEKNTVFVPNGPRSVTEPPAMNSWGCPQLFHAACGAMSEPAPGPTLQENGAYE